MDFCHDPLCPTSEPPYDRPMKTVSLVCKICGGDNFHGNMQCVVCDPPLMFDPEKVERRTLRSGSNSHYVGKFVSESDYDALLALYREHVPACPCAICGKEAKGAKANIVGFKDCKVCAECMKEAY